MSKKEFEALVNSILYRTGMTREQLSVDMGYNKGYISQMLSRNQIPGKFVNALKTKYPENKDDSGSSTKDEIIEVDRSFINEVLMRNVLWQIAKDRADRAGEPQNWKQYLQAIDADNIEIMNDLVLRLRKMGKQAFVPVLSSSSE